MQEVLVAHPQRDCRNHQQPKQRGEALHPMRSARANRPVGLNKSTMMMIRNPIASREPEEMYPAPISSTNARKKPPRCAPVMLRSPPRMTMPNAFSEARSPMEVDTRTTVLSKPPSAGPSPE